MAAFRLFPASSSLSLSLCLIHFFGLAPRHPPPFARLRRPPLRVARVWEHGHSRTLISHVRVERGGWRRQGCESMSRGARRRNHQRTRPTPPTPTPPPLPPPRRPAPPDFGFQINGSFFFPRLETRRSPTPVVGEIRPLRRRPPSCTFETSIFRSRVPPLSPFPFPFYAANALLFLSFPSPPPLPFPRF